MSISLSNITKRFGKNTVIDNFSLSLDKGSRTAILSSSGSGKTTLFRIVSGLDKRFEGERKVEGSISFMFQEDRLFENSTVLENVTCVSDRPKSEAISMLDSLGVGDCKDMYPSELSGGMKRRVALARALFYDGDIVLLDECFTGLDQDTRKIVADVINTNTKDKTLVLISHSREEAELLNCRVMLFDNGFTQK